MAHRSGHEGLRPGRPRWLAYRRGNLRHITVILLCRLAQNLFHSPALTLLSGLFLATDGMAIVMSRTSILDGFLAMFTLAAFLCVVKDQETSQPRLLAKLQEWDGLGTPRHGWNDLRAFLSRHDRRPFAVGPNAGNRPWLLAAGILAGLACSVKWSGIYALAFLGIFVAIREITCRWRAGHPSPIRGALLADIWWAFILMVPHGGAHLHCVMVRMVCPPWSPRTRTFRNFRIRRFPRRPMALPQGDVDIP